MKKISYLICLFILILCSQINAQTITLSEYSIVNADTTYTYEIIVEIGRPVGPGIVHYYVWYKLAGDGYTLYEKTASDSLNIPITEPGTYYVKVQTEILSYRPGGQTRKLQDFEVAPVQSVEMMTSRDGHFDDMYVFGDLWVTGSTIVDGYVKGTGAHVFRQDAAPTAALDTLATGDIWIDTNDGDRPRTWTGAVWTEALTIIDAGKILTGYIRSTVLRADSIKTGVLNADLMTTGTLTVGVVPEAGSISGQGTLATQSSVGTGDLNTTIINGGKIVTGLISADSINVGTLTGRRVQTAASGKRVVLDKDTNSIKFYDGITGDSSLTIDTNILGLAGIRIDNNGILYIRTDADNYSYINASGGGRLVMAATDALHPFIHLEYHPGGTGYFIDCYDSLDVRQFAVHSNGNAILNGNLVIYGTVDGIDVSAIPSTYAPISHAHAGSDITSGNLDTGGTVKSTGSFSAVIGGNTRVGTTGTIVCDGVNVYVAGGIIYQIGD